MESDLAIEFIEREKAQYAPNQGYVGKVQNRILAEAQKTSRRHLPDKLPPRPKMNLGALQETRC